MLVTISFSSVICADSEKEAAKESPLYKLRGKQALGERINNILKSIKSEFLGQRMFVFPLFRKNLEGSLLTTCFWTDCSTIGCKFC